MRKLIQVRAGFGGSVWNPLFGPAGVRKKKRRRILQQHAQEQREARATTSRNSAAEDYSHFYAMERAYKDRRRAR